LAEKRIRPATGDDAARVAALISESFQDVARRFELTADNAPTHPANCRPDWVEGAMAKGVRYFVLETGGEPIGCVALERADPTRCYLERLAVLPKHRRQGLGAVLVRHALAEARDWGASRVEIALIAAQDELRAWYERLGFSLISTKDFDHLPFTVAFMGLDL
jgi:GNAT superfamily N-acetyltransferase